MHNGAWHLYGHVHSKNEYERGKSLDVGWDAFKAPISFREINAIMETKPILNEGHHY
jgi:calcineurin-like phosphoesterase family protein